MRKARAAGATELARRDADDDDDGDGDANDADDGDDDDDGAFRFDGWRVSVDTFGRASAANRPGQSMENSVKLGKTR